MTKLKAPTLLPPLKMGNKVINEDNLPQSNERIKNN